MLRVDLFLATSSIIKFKNGKLEYYNLDKSSSSIFLQPTAAKLPFMKYYRECKFNFSIRFSMA